MLCVYVCVCVCVCVCVGVAALQKYMSLDMAKQVLPTGRMPKASVVLADVTSMVFLGQQAAKGMTTCADFANFLLQRCTELARASKATSFWLVGDTDKVTVLKAWCHYRRGKSLSPGTEPRGLASDAPI